MHLLLIITVKYPGVDELAFCAGDSLSQVCTAKSTAVL
jgi:hypothetical protein